ncbi:phosphotransferase-like protein [Paenibacillus paeoniae]|uniref:Chemotaxis protein n=1 Tax=Paenibacillus paeoniae TaxID=2292705 RepID=A0A371PKN3_9BACL|nr:AAA family ATPase [Paenibacillus paeoniae]REK76752.1 chemotaxis protein [Paenibacillus paeoniae]
MNRGKIIFLNGVTSAGKTSIVEAIQSQSEQFYYVVANDLFEETIGERYLREDYWKYLSEAIMLMYHTAKLFSDHGKNVLIDGIMVERPELKPHYGKVKEIFSGYPLSIIEVFCPLDICRERNIARGNRREDQSQEQHDMMARDIPYHYSVNTGINSPEQCADLILNHI